MTRPVLTTHPAEPKVPTRKELEDAILAFARFRKHMGDRESPFEPVRVLLRLADELEAGREVSHNARGVDSDGFIPEKASDIGVGSLPPLHAALRRWVEARSDTTRSGSEAWQAYESATNDLDALARSVLGVGERE